MSWILVIRRRHYNRSMNSVLVLTACNNSCLNREVIGPYCSSSCQGCGSRHFYWIIDYSPGLPPFLFAAGLANHVCLCSSITAPQDAHKRFSAAGCWMAHCFTRLVFKGGVRHELTTVGYLSLIRWGLYGLMGGAFLTKWVGIYGLGSYGKESCYFLWKYDAGLQGSTFPVIAWPQVLVMYRIC